MKRGSFILLFNCIIFVVVDASEDLEEIYVDLGEMYTEPPVSKNNLDTVDTNRVF